MTLPMFYRRARGNLVKLDEIVGSDIVPEAPTRDAAWRLMLSGGSWLDVSQDDYTAIVEMLERRMGLV